MNMQIDGRKLRFAATDNLFNSQIAGRRVAS